APFKEKISDRDDIETTLIRSANGNRIETAGGDRGGFQPGNCAGGGSGLCGGGGARRHVRPQSAGNRGGGRGDQRPVWSGCVRAGAGRYGRGGRASVRAAGGAPLRRRG